jgi:hypothetical protein
MPHQSAAPSYRQIINPLRTGTLLSYSASWVWKGAGRPKPFVWTARAAGNNRNGAIVREIVQFGLCPHHFLSKASIASVRDGNKLRDCEGVRETVR